MTWRDKKDLEKQVYQKFPVSKAELKCRNEKKIMDDLRDKYRKKLTQGFVSKREY
jgi:predicted DNA-binding protein (UPF0278 family)